MVFSLGCIDPHLIPHLHPRLRFRNGADARLATYLHHNIYYIALAQISAWYSHTSFIPNLTGAIDSTRPLQELTYMNFIMLRSVRPLNVPQHLGHHPPFLLFPYTIQPPSAYIRATYTIRTSSSVKNTAHTPRTYRNTSFPFAKISQRSTTRLAEHDFDRQVHERTFIETTTPHNDNDATDVI
jgi:hypothetical protein